MMDVLNSFYSCDGCAPSTVGILGLLQSQGQRPTYLWRQNDLTGFLEAKYAMEELRDLKVAETGCVEGAGREHRGLGG
jgi:hypothetical protein